MKRTARNEIELINFGQPIQFDVYLLEGLMVRVSGAEIFKGLLLAIVAIFARFTDLTSHFVLFYVKQIKL